MVIESSDQQYHSLPPLRHCERTRPLVIARSTRRSNPYKFLDRHVGVPSRDDDGGQGSVRKINPNLISLTIFILVTTILTPLALQAVNRDSKTALLSPIPASTDPMPPIKDNSVILAAAPSTKSATPEDSTTTQSNSTGNSFIFPAGTTEIDIYNPKVSGQSYIYLIPKTKTNTVVSVKSKSAGKFTATISPAEVVDLTIDYLLINQ